MRFVLKNNIWTKLGISCGVTVYFYTVRPQVLDLERNYLKSGNLVNWLSGKYTAGLISEKPELSDNLKHLIDCVLAEACHFDEKQKNRIKFDTHSALDALNINTVKFGSSALILLPDYFNVQSASELKAAKLNELLKREYNYSIKDNNLWLSTAGLKLIDSFVLSPKAKKFEIANQIYLTNDSSFYVNFSALLLGTFFILSLTSLLVKGRKFGWNQKDGILAANYVLISLGTFTFLPLSCASMRYDAEAKAISNGVSAKILRKSDNAKEMINNEYYSGAMEYYSKVKQRQQALSELMATEPWWSRNRRRFTQEGEKSGFTQPSTIEDHVGLLEEYVVGRKKIKEKKVEFV